MIGLGKADKSEIKILVIDDNQATRDILQEMLRDIACQVTTANNGREALLLLRSQPKAFDLLITDFDMPLLNGKELIRQIAFLCPDLPVILSTACHQFDEKEIGSWGVNALLKKPYSHKELKITVQKVLDH